MLLPDNGSRTLLPAVYLRHNPKFASIERVITPLSACKFYLYMEEQTLGQAGHANTSPMSHGCFIVLTTSL